MIAVRQTIGKERTVIYSDMVRSNGGCLSKNGKTRSRVGFRAISKNRSAIGMCKKVLKKKKRDRKM